MTQTGILKVGITGGIGSGKTTACRLFETLDVPVYYADERAKWLMVNELSLVSELKKLFGEAAFFADGSLNRKLISAAVFSDKLKLDALNSLVHPAVFRDWERWQTGLSGVPYSLREAALLVETGSHLFLDKLIVVTAPQSVRIQRVMSRDGVSKEEVEARISRQLPEEEKVKLADFVIQNDGSAGLIRQVWRIHQSLKNLAEMKVL